MTHNGSIPPEIWVDEEGWYATELPDARRFVADEDGRPWEMEYYRNRLALQEVERKHAEEARRYQAANEEFEEEYRDQRQELKVVRAELAVAERKLIALIPASQLLERWSRLRRPGA